MLTLERIEQLRHTTGKHQSRQRYTDEEMGELLDVAEMLALISDWQRHCDDPDIRWVWSSGLSWTRDKNVGYPTPQAAVLAALGPKGDPDAPKD